MAYIYEQLVMLFACHFWAVHVYNRLIERGLGLGRPDLLFTWQQLITLIDWARNSSAYPPARCYLPLLVRRSDFVPSGIHWLIMHKCCLLELHSNGILPKPI